ncbi:ly6/PLAUR domain-containing protein 6-like [Boleophthalmus pectinirostris]|uniref:ly6/PLAUR domain-containing protein 6-like n=1 Tax=Boleophthalmus pectinirostris TaxID=150288 RepID=UPI00242C2EEE|nr:ly6/PLAUR domain-containing protein 6-like [Boleophthalmus pectinirostris]
MHQCWPMACVLLLSTVSKMIEETEARDFTANDIVHLHPSTTPHPGGFKCFTCQEAKDNYECNRWAPDLYCPKETRYCYTLHVMDSAGNSVSVSKRCASLDECRFTGCAPLAHNGQQVCSSCCEGNICNLWVPRNESNAIFSSMSPLRGAGSKLTTTILTNSIIIFIFINIWTFARD